MSFRRRLALSCGAAVAVVVVVGSALAYWIVRDTLRGQIDASLRQQAEVGAVSIEGGDRMLLTEEPRAFTRVLTRERGAEPLPAPLDDDPDYTAVAEGQQGAVLRRP